MDLIDFEAQPLYFDEALPPGVLELVEAAGARYGEPEAEALLARAHAAAPTHLLVQVARYRYFFYNHRLAEAEQVVWHAIGIAAERLRLPASGYGITRVEFGSAVADSMTLTRFYLSAVKAAAYLKMRSGELAMAITLLEGIVSLDPADRLGARSLLEVAREHVREHTPGLAA